MSWRALVPVKAGKLAKSRLAGALTGKQRRRLSHVMFEHVLRTLREVGEIEQIGVVSRHPPADPALFWLPDEGRGLNAELARARRRWADSDILVIHADLPLVSADEIEAMLAAAELLGSAVAPDRHGSGTNAIAVKAGRTVRFRFGSDSLRRHMAALHPSASVRRQGLAVDVDDPEDLAHVMRSVLGSKVIS